MSVKRAKTRYRCIYYNEATRRYDVKFNYKSFDPKAGKTVYRSKWVYGLGTIAEAQSKLAALRLDAGKPAVDTNVTIADAFELWKLKAQAQQYSVTTVRNTEKFVSMLEPFLPLDTRVADLDEDGYYRLFADLRAHGYAEETIHTLNATFKKLVQIAYKRGLIQDNFLHRADCIRTRKKETVRILTDEEWRRIDETLVRRQDCPERREVYLRLRLLYNLLYYTGVRIGECLALTWEDFRPGPGVVWLNVDKSILPNGDVKEPKNYKRREIPLSKPAEQLYRQEHRRDRYTSRIFHLTAGYCLQKIKEICQASSVEPCTCHDFRHTFISNLIRRNVPLPVVEQVSGDTQQTIFQRYSHMFESDRMLIRRVFE